MIFITLIVLLELIKILSSQEILMVVFLDGKLKKTINYINFSHSYYENFHVSHSFLDKENVKGP